ncbi:hypothetical protein [Paenibacillus sp. J2TS4]|uniref:hypothetical protein n=1 Tax=Paenibacillus sp. J2TS4 TaxID=2807194 RepID=UPI001B0070CE|nr:hypothetical protein [Paenibacillus sp. J2TS4]GIP35006.1 hypothetical protein J2TS4_42160 [Paenibacillus sp. J2TS4]
MGEIAINGIVGEASETGLPSESPAGKNSHDFLENLPREGQAAQKTMTKGNANGRNHRFCVHVSVENMDEQQAIDYLNGLFRHAGLREVHILPIDQPNRVADEEKTIVEERRAQSDDNAMVERIRYWMAERQLIWLILNDNHEARGRIPCRILNFDESSGLLTIYHVDEKKVYTYKLEEVDEFLE